MSINFKITCSVISGELAGVLDHLYGSVCYVGIDIDPELKYPKGAARVTFTTEQSFVAAISGRFVYIPHADMSKRVISISSNYNFSTIGIHPILLAYFHFLQSSIIVNWF